jgi:hypothetical protein
MIDGQPIPIHSNGSWGCGGISSTTADFSTYDSYLNPNARCPVCGDAVFYYQSPFGGRVFFDDVGWPWPKHPCTDNGARIRAYTPKKPRVTFVASDGTPLTVGIRKGVEKINDSTTLVIREASPDKSIFTATISADDLTLKHLSSASSLVLSEQAVGFINPTKGAIETLPAIVVRPKVFVVVSTPKFVEKGILLVVRKTSNSPGRTQTFRITIDPKWVGQKKARHYKSILRESDLDNGSEILIQDDHLVFLSRRHGHTIRLPIKEGPKEF